MRLKASGVEHPLLMAAGWLFGVIYRVYAAEVVSLLIWRIDREIGNRIYC
jgi:hypothetical protein